MIREIVPTGYTQTFPTGAGDHRVVVASGAAVGGLDFGNQPVPNLPPVIQPIEDLVLDVGESVRSP